jgi:hypothetical protein
MNGQLLSNLYYAAFVILFAAVAHSGAPTAPAQCGLPTLPTCAPLGRGMAVYEVDGNVLQGVSADAEDTWTARVAVGVGGNLALAAFGSTQPGNDSVGTAAQFRLVRVGDVALAVGGSTLHQQQAGTTITQGYVVATGTIHTQVVHSRASLTLTGGVNNTVLRNTDAEFSVQAWRVFTGMELAVGPHWGAAAEWQSCASTLEYAPVTSQVVRYTVSDSLVVQAGRTNAMPGNLGEGAGQWFVGVCASSGGQ